MTSLLKILALWSLPLQSLYQCGFGFLERAPGFLGREQDTEQQLTEEAKEQEYLSGRRHEIQRCTLPAAPPACTRPQHQVSPGA